MEGRGLSNKKRGGVFENWRNGGKFWHREYDLKSEHRWHQAESTESNSRENKPEV